jgi:hypothetical protein
MKVAQEEISSTLGVHAVLTGQPIYVHRINADGTIDSICRKCFITIASSQWEAELLRSESAHRCDSLRLEYLNNSRNRASERDRSESRERSLGG